MDLRHLRYFVAVAESGSLTVAAETVLHTAQPSLSRQIRDLENHVGTALLTRSVRGIALTSAGRAFLDHARLALAEVEAAGVAARRAAQPAKATFALGFLTGQEMEWLPEAMHVLRDELPNVDVTVSSGHSPDLADALMNGTMDAAFMRTEPRDLVFEHVVDEPLVVVLPSDHRLASRKAIDLHALVGEPLIGVSGTAPSLRAVIGAYLRERGLSMAQRYAADNLAMAISLVASTPGFALLPRYARNILPRSVVARPIKGKGASIPLVLAFHKSNASPLLARFVQRFAERATGPSRKR